MRIARFNTNWSSLPVGNRRGAIEARFASSQMVTVIINTPEDEMDSGPAMIFSSDVVQKIIRHGGRRAFNNVFRIAGIRPKRLEELTFYIANPKAIFRKMSRKLRSPHTRNRVSLFLKPLKPTIDANLN